LTVCERTPGTRRGRHSETRTFKTTTGSLGVMRARLVKSGVTIAAMESTSTYWKPPFSLHSDFPGQLPLPGEVRCLCGA
jgi:transposase